LTIKGADMKINIIDFLKQFRCKYTNEAYAHDYAHLCYFEYPYYNEAGLKK
jgi:hypothetical protein